MVGNETLLQQTASRCQPWIPEERVWVVTNAMHAAETARQLPNVPADQILLEPCGRNTAPCIGLAAVRLLAVDPEAEMLVMPADHVISTSEQFQQAAQTAVNHIRENPEALALFGVPPTYPATGFGYIERGDAIAAGSFRVTAFREKPDAAVAQQYVASGRYYWNCGIFCWRAGTVVDRLKQFEPEIGRRLERIQASLVDGRDWESTLAAEFPAMPSISIDYAVLERAKDVLLVPATFTWDDVGSWQALERLLGTNAAGHTIDGAACVVDSQNVIIRSTPDHLVGVVGVKDLIIVHTPAATLVARRDDEGALRTLISAMEREGYHGFL